MSASHQSHATDCYLRNLFPVPPQSLVSYSALFCVCTVFVYLPWELPLAAAVLPVPFSSTFVCLLWDFLHSFCPLFPLALSAFPACVDLFVILFLTAFVSLVCFDFPTCVMQRWQYLVVILECDSRLFFLWKLWTYFCMILFLYIWGLLLQVI